MAKILVINPNSSEQMTEDIRKTFAANGIKDTEVALTQGAPHVLETNGDYIKAGAAVMKNLESVMKNCALQEEEFPYRGVLLACFGDPGLFGLKELCPVPVIGIAEASMALSLLLGAKFSILAASEKAGPMMENLVMTYGLTNRLASVETLGMPIDAFMQDEEALTAGILEACENSRRKGAEVLLLGCAGMTMIGNKLKEGPPIPVTDPILAGYWQLTAIADGGFPLSRGGLYAERQRTGHVKEQREDRSIHGKTVN